MSQILMCSKQERRTRELRTAWRGKTHQLFEKSNSPCRWDCISHGQHARAIEKNRSWRKEGKREERRKGREEKRSWDAVSGSSSIKVCLISRAESFTACMDYISDSSRINQEVSWAGVGLLELRRLPEAEGLLHRQASPLAPFLSGNVHLIM